MEAVLGKGQQSVDVVGASLALWPLFLPLHWLVGFPQPQDYSLFDALYKEQ